ncbi:helix-turn-helix domain-containing protein [Streptomyces sp. NPDC004539]|uniref:helix-turn-helix domain-containing protein n=1 Tax=Streptomyces sp. NPDC004539 TaxID=3154280 RepID=UPI0033BA50AC
MTDSGQGDRQTAQRRLGAALRELQRRSGLTLRELEKLVPVSDSSLSRYFRGDGVAPWSVVAEICRRLDGDPRALRALWEEADRLSPAKLPGDPPTATPPAPARRRLTPAHLRALAVALTAVLLGTGLAVYGTRLAGRTGEGTTTAAVGKGVPHGSVPQESGPVFHEAEKARTRQVTVREATGARSGKAIAHMDYPDSYVEFTVDAATAGPRSMSVRFSNGSQDSGGGPSCASHGLAVNGVVANPVHYPHTGWENWQRTEPVTVVLREGRNTIRFSKGDLYTELDGIELA